MLCDTTVAYAKKTLAKKSINFQETNMAKPSVWLIRKRLCPLHNQPETNPTKAKYSIAMYARNQ